MVNFKKELKVGDNLLECIPMFIKEEWYKLHLKALGGKGSLRNFQALAPLRNYCMKFPTIQSILKKV